MILAVRFFVTASGREPAREKRQQALDTNTVVSALLFDKGRLVWIRQAWQSSVFAPLVDHDTASELIRVLGYPKLKLTQSEQETLLGDFLPYAETIPSYEWPAELPEIRDPKDVMFLALAKHAGADALVSGDGDILALRGQLGSVVILPVAEFSEWLSQ